MTPPAAGAAAPELEPDVDRALAPAHAPVPRRQRRPGAPQLRVASVQPARRSTLRVAGPVLMCLLFVCVLGIAAFQALLVQTQSRIDDLDEAAVLEESRAEQLRVELAALQSPERIVDEARDRLGMVPPEQILYLQHDPARDVAASDDGSPLP